MPRRQERGLWAALDVSKALLAGREPDAVLELVADRARALAQADGAIVRIAGAGDQTLVLRAVSERSGGCGLPPLMVRDLPVRGSICGIVFETGRAHLFSDLWQAWRALPSARGRPELALALQQELCGPALLVPLRAAGRALGVLMVSNATGRAPFRKHHLDTLERFANQVALAVEQAHLALERDRLALLEERRRLGRDLHDGAIQSLYAVTLRLAAAIERAQDRPLEDQLASLTTNVDAVIADLRGHVSALRSGAGDPAGVGD